MGGCPEPACLGCAPPRPARSGRGWLRGQCALTLIVLHGLRLIAPSRAQLGKRLSENRPQAALFKPRNYFRGLVFLVTSNSFDLVANGPYAFAAVFIDWHLISSPVPICN